MDLMDSTKLALASYLHAYQLVIHVFDDENRVSAEDPSDVRVYEHGILLLLTPTTSTTTICCTAWLDL